MKSMLSRVPGAAFGPAGPGTGGSSHRPLAGPRLAGVAILTVLAAATVPLVVWGQQSVAISPQDQRVAATKDAALRDHERWRATAQAAPVLQDQATVRQQREQLNPPPAPAPAGSPLVRVPAGSGYIVESRLAPFPSSQFSVLNKWGQQKDGFAVTVYAGVDGQDHSQGMVFVRVTSPASPEGTGAFVRAPRKTGPLRVTGAVEERLSLESPDGTRFTFDVAAAQFVATP